MTILFRDASSESQDSTVIDNVDYLDAFDFSSVNAYKNRLQSRNPDHPFNNLANEEFLVKVRAIEYKNNKYHPTLAGLLMFGKTSEILKQLPHFFLEYINYGNSHNRWDDRVVYDGTWGEGNIFNFLTIVMPKLLNTAQNRFSLEDDGVTRKGYSDIQLALREAFINSLIHADYRIEDRIQIKYVNNDYIFTNPGSLRISVEEFYNGRRSKPRNPNIALMFRIIGLAEEAGSGVETILKAANSNNLPKPQIDISNNKVSLRIETTPLVDYLTKKFSLDKREYDVLKAIHDGTALRRTEIQELTGYSRGIVLNVVNSMLKKGIISQIGKSSATKYIISEDHINSKERTINTLERMISIIQNN